MTILQALASHYERLDAKGDVPTYGYSRERISYAIVLSAEGKAVDVQSLLDTSTKKPRPTLRQVPQPVTRTSSVAANFLWDKTSYAFGVKRNPVTSAAIDAEREHQAFKTLHEDLLSATDDAGLQALLSFLREWNPRNYTSLRHAEAMLGENVIFQLEGVQNGLHDRPAANLIWMDHLARADNTEGICLVSGKRAPMARLHPVLKGVRGAQSAGGRIVTFNLDAFESLGKNQGDNAPVSIQAAFAYTTALNSLLAFGSRQRIQLSDTTVVFWAEAAGNEEMAAAAEELFAALAEPPTDTQEAAAIANTLTAIASGQPLESVRPDIQRDTRFYVLGLAPNAARLSVRFWHMDTIGQFAERIVEHWNDLHLDPAPWQSPPAAWLLLRATAVQGKAENVPPTLGGALLRAILLGGRYPRTLFASTIGRIRADKPATGKGRERIDAERRFVTQVAICRACLARDYRLGFEKEDVPVSLNPHETNPAYRLGRLFAVYEGVQRAALGTVNATIKDRYFGAASATPASIFPLLERNSAHHLAALRKGDKGGLAHWFEREIDAIFDGVDTAFPRSLRLEDQGRFALGYHHQRAAKRGVSDSGESALPPNSEERVEP